MRPDDLVRIRHMIEAIRSAARFAAGRSRDDLDKDEMLAFALVRAIEIVGEAATRVSVETREAHADIPWAEIIGMRHRLVHAYFDINYDILWATATEAAPDLLPLLLPLLSTD
jgi:uncharacterized protein with HEPN domain